MVSFVVRISACHCAPVLWLGWAVLLVVAASSGCSRQEQVRSYSTPKQAALDKLHGVEPVAKQSVAKQQAPAPGSPARMLGAIVPLADQGLFFKVTGAPAAVERHAAEFAAFVDSLHFATSGKPAWKLPDGWAEEPGSGMRMATLRIADKEQPLELSVIPLPRAEGDTDESAYLLSNINRWRGQLKLDPLDAKALTAETKRKKVDGHDVVTCDFTGQQGDSGMPGMGMMPGSMGAGPFAGGPASAPVAGPAAPAKAAADGTKPEYRVPAGWTEKAVGPFAVAAFQVMDEGRQVDVTISSAGGELLANVNRWRGQLQLEPLNEDELKKELKSVAVGSTTGQLVELVGPESSGARKAIFGAVVPRGDRSWFFKLTGDAQLAEREKPKFEEFLKSVTLP